MSGAVGEWQPGSSGSMEQSAAGKQLVFPAALNSYQRHVLHQVAELNGVHHESVGQGASRRICIGDPQGEKVQVR